MRSIEASDALGARFAREAQVGWTRELIAGQTIFVPGGAPWPVPQTLRRHGFRLRREGPMLVDGVFGWSLWTEPIPGFEPKAPSSGRGRPRLY